MNSLADTSQTDVDLSTASSRGMGGRIAANTGLLGAARLLSTLMGVATLIVTARALDNKVDFGTVLFVHAYMLFFAGIASFQTWQAIIRFGADNVRDQDPVRLGRLFKFGFKLDAIAAVLAYGLAIALFGGFIWIVESFPALGASADDLDLPVLKKLVFAYCLVLLFRQISASTGIFRLFDKFGVLAVRALVMPALRLAGALLAWSQGWGVIGFICIWFFASAVSYLLLPVLAIRELLKRRLFRYVLQSDKSLREPIAGLWPFVLKANVDSSLAAFRTHFPSLLVMGVFGPAILAVFRVAEEVARLLSRGTKLFDQVLYPELSRLVSEGQLKALFSVALKAALAVGGICVVLTLLVLTFGENVITRGLGEGYEQAPLLAVMLLAGAGLMGASVPFYTVFYVLMRPGLAAWIRAASILIYVVAFFAVLRSAELFTPGWAAIISAAVEITLVALMAVFVLKRYKTPSI